MNKIKDDFKMLLNETNRQRLKVSRENATIRNSKILSVTLSALVDVIRDSLISFTILKVLLNCSIGFFDKKVWS